mmetsp:Transcript_10057/g.11672  ORF Transcript_10057/g.11672 Transcript_10057/m.11672 type:complete len:119 (-) Transcript_10057:204-560(-)
MWSYGRSATGSFMESFKKSSGMSYCNGKKEGFNRHRVLENRPLTSLALQNCMRWGERLLHMQPVQLEGKDSELRNYATGFLQGGVQGRLQNSGGQLPREPASTGRLILQKSWMATQEG